MLRAERDCEIQANEPQKPSYETLAPHPDFAMLIDKFPFFVMEISSGETYESDRWRMLLYAAAILRTHEAFAKSERANQYKPMIVACFVRDGMASVYIVYLDEPKNINTTVRALHILCTWNSYHIHILGCN